MHSVFNANSLALFRSLTSGADYPMVVLSQVNSSGQTIASWSLGLVVVTSDDVSGDGSGALPSEEFYLAFGSITEATPSVTSPGATESTPQTAFFSQITNSDHEYQWHLRYPRHFGTFAPGGGLVANPATDPASICS